MGFAETWRWHVIVQLDNGAEVTRWRCDSQEMARRECDAIKDTIMAGTGDAVDAWVKEVTQ
jgi:hypothetical protein